MTQSVLEGLIAKEISSLEHQLEQYGHSGFMRAALRVRLQNWKQAHTDLTSREVIAYTHGDEVILAKFWTGESPPEGWTPLYR